MPCIDIVHASLNSNQQTNPYEHTTGCISYQIQMDILITMALGEYNFVLESSGAPWGYSQLQIQSTFHCIPKEFIKGIALDEHSLSPIRYP